MHRIASAVLDVAPDRIRVRYANTGEAPFNPGAGGSRLTLVHSGLSEMEVPIVTAGWTSGLDQLRQAGAARAAAARRAGA